MEGQRGDPGSVAVNFYNIPQIIINSVNIPPHPNCGRLSVLLCVIYRRIVNCPSNRGLSKSHVTRVEVSYATVVVPSRCLVHIEIRTWSTTKFNLSWGNATRRR